MTGQYDLSVPVLTLRLTDAPPVSEQPEVRLARWAIHEVGNALHLIGWNLDQNRPRYTSPIAQFDRQARTAVTQSGRRYQLTGEPGPDPLVLLAWQVSCQIRGERSMDVTQQILCPQ